MTDQEVFELGQLYAELSIIRGMINGGDGVRQRLLPQSECDELERIAVIADAQIKKLIGRIDQHKYAKT
jgi:hypothetical protein